jgi:hypothetical protein
MFQTISDSGLEFWILIFRVISSFEIVSNLGNKLGAMKILNLDKEVLWA